MPVFVVGMHRSGTSAVARAVNLLGVPIGEAADLMPASETNPKGYWESSALRAFNDELLEFLGGTWSAPPKLEIGWEKEPCFDSARDRARMLFRAIYSTREWIWKDPRNSIMLPFWMDALAVRPAVVLTYRNPLEIWRSLASRDGFSKATALGLWERYLRQAIINVRGLPVFVASYERLLKDPRGLCSEMRAFFQAHGVFCGSADRTIEIQQFLEAKLRHSTYGSRELDEDPGIAAEQRQLFHLLEKVAGGHTVFAASDIGFESSSTEDLLAERRRLEFERNGERAERSRLERLVVALLDRIADSAVGARNSEVVAPRAPAPHEPNAYEDRAGYQAWIERRRRVLEEDRARLRRQLSRLPGAPEISLLLALHKPQPRELQQTLDSIRSQIHSKWQICLCDNGSDDSGLTAVLEEASHTDPRIRVTRASTRLGICAAFNTALDLATGEFVGTFGQGDSLPFESLAEIAVAIAENPNVDVVYTDEDRISDDGLRFEPFFKPDWSPDYLLSYPYTGRLLVVRRSLVESVGRYRPEFEGAEDYDLALRATEYARRITHLAKVLYHRRHDRHFGSPYDMSEEFVTAATRSALRRALERRGEIAQIEDGEYPVSFHVKRAIRTNPRVSIIIPFRDEPELLRRCLSSIRRLSDYDRWQAILVDNGSWQPATRALLRQLSTERDCSVLCYAESFNWSAINNWAASHCDTELLLFLNNDTEAVRQGWLAALIQHAERPDIGAVGARLLYPNGLVQHAGVILGFQGTAEHAFRFLPAESAGYFGMAKLIRNCGAVTGACMMVRRRVFEEVGGFDESLGVAFSDVDFCLRLRERGYRIVYAPFAELLHYESVSRGTSDELPEAQRVAGRWLRWVRADPYFNPNLSLRRANFALPEDGEVEPWKDLVQTFEKS